MKNNILKKHLSFNEYDLEILTNKEDNYFSKIKVSEKSYFNDKIWILDGSEVYKKHYLEINWEDIIPDNSLFYFELENTVKKCIFYCQTTLCSQIPKKPLTQTQIVNYFKVLLVWMSDNNINKFCDFNEEKFKAYYDWVQLKKNYKGESIKNKNNYIIPLKLLYIYREYIDDSIYFDVTKGESIYKFVKAKEKNINQTKAIPTSILEDLLKNIIPIINYIDKNNHLTPDDLIKSKIINVKYSNTFLNVLNAIVYSIVGLYTGMRVSEILNIKKDSISLEGETVLLSSTLIKTTTTKKGREEMWACGLNNENNYALKAINILKRLTPETHKNLFFKYVNDKYEILDTTSINNHLQTMLNSFNINWSISTHQFRRTFARLIGTTDKTNLLALQQHFKHVSISMTSYYVGNEIDLLEMIDEEKKVEIANELENILGAKNLAGKLGEKLIKSNINFRGKAGEKLRKDYIENLINNSDLIVMPHEYGFCIYQPEQAKCQGEQKNIGLNTCVKCSNFVVSNKHKVFWINRTNEYEKFASEIEKLPNQEITFKELQYNINEAKQIIQKIEGDKNETTL